MNITINISADLVAVVSAAISVLAMTASLWQAFSAHGSLKLSKQIYDSSKPHFTFDDIIDCYVVNNLSNEIVQIKFFIFLTNLSDKAMVIRDLRLRVVGEEQEVILNPIANKDLAICGENIAQNSSIKKWVQFDLGRDLYENLKILKYTIVAQDSYGNMVEKSAICVREELTKNE